MNDPRTQRILSSCLEDNYGVRGAFSRHSGENVNFLVRVGQDRKYVVKIVDEAVPPAAIELQYAAIEHAVEAGFPVRLPRIIKNQFANIETRLQNSLNGFDRLILMEFIDGNEMSSLSDISEILVFEAGQTLGRFDMAMRDFQHSAARRNHRWNLAAADQHADKIELIEGSDRRDLLGWAFGSWRAARAGLESVPWQFIHGDGHDENLLVSGDRVVGLIDFGDCCHNPRVCELAICATYLMMRCADPILRAATALSGYQEHTVLSADELGLLYPLICGRLAVSIGVANERKTIDPDNPNWFGGEQSAWDLLDYLRGIGPQAFERKVARSV